MANAAAVEIAQKYYDILNPKSRKRLVNEIPVRETEPDAKLSIDKTVVQVVQEADGSMQIIFSDRTDLTIPDKKITAMLTRAFEGKD